jgi:hypothetical protein
MHRLLRLAAIPAAIVVAMLPAAASADSMTLTLPGSAALSARINVMITLTIHCPAPPAGSVTLADGASVTVEQAAGTGVASGSLFILDPAPNLPFPCDGSTVQRTFSILASPSGAPFHGGPAIVSAFAFAQYGIDLCPPFGCFSSTGSANASVVGTVLLKVTATN